MFWKIHLVLYAVANGLLTIGAALLWDNETYTWDALLALVLGLLAMVPLYGNAFNKAIGYRAVWAVVALALLVLDVIVPLYQMLPYWDQLSWDHSRWSLVVGEFVVLLLLIYFAAMVRYLWLRPQLWAARTSA